MTVEFGVNPNENLDLVDLNVCVEVSALLRAILVFQCDLYVSC